MKKRLTVITIWLLLCFLPALALAGCSAAGREKEAGQTAPDGRPKIQVITTIFPPYDFVRQVGGDYVEADMLLKPGMEAHSYEPSPRDIIRITESDLFLYAGGESDVWVEDLLEGSDSHVHAHSLLEWVEPLEEETAEGMQTRGHDHDHAHDHNHDSGSAREEIKEEAGGGTENTGVQDAGVQDAGVHLEEGEYDEHVWTSPANAILIVEKIRDTLSAIDPDRAGIYEENARTYLEQLRRLDSEYRRVTGEAKRHTIIFGDRFPFLYLVKTYGLDYHAAFPGCSSETEPSAATIAFLTDEVRQEHIPVVFYLELSNAKVADAIAEATGTRTAMLHSCHTLTREEMQRGENYLSLMRQNLEQLKLALNE